MAEEKKKIIQFKNIVKSFEDGQVVLKGVSLDIYENEFVTLLGPSGCGKTTLLRILGGFLQPSEGKVLFDGEDIVSVPPYKREINTVFQKYALFPHMDVYDNIAFGLTLKKEPKDVIEQKVMRMLRLVSLEDYAHRNVTELSGGQQQRVALARMLAARPGILMLDEPFSALDSHLKGVLEQNLVSLFEAFEGTILYVSHDIDESLRFCDRIAVVDAGRIVEMDRGRELVNRPQSVAGLKLSGCKNAPAAEYAGPHAVHVPPWGIDVHTAQEVPRDVKCLGLRAFYVERAEGPGENCYRVRVDRVSDARFERMALLGFLDRDDADGAAVAFETNEMSYLHQHMFWRVSMREGVALPEVGERLWVRIPPDKVYLVSR